ncbi:DUF6079 family protein [Promicromonospora sp. NPDC050262]|uniref:DUF6079 family protein n=1 Tax=Promicromonospora sp. NPDC050262 TaxID=3155036 RepID=UPI0033EB33D4
MGTGGEEAWKEGCELMSDLSLPLREVIDIPAEVHVDDFVMRLHQGVPAAERTLADYVVTDSIAEAFDEGLSLVGSALSSGASKGAFIHGSFGAGKSHYMAVMHLLLTGNATARALKGLQGPVQKHLGVLGRNLLAIDYHLLTATSIEEALFGGYLSTVKERHPDQAPPVLHRSEALLEDADRLRARLEDEKFFEHFGEGTSGAVGGWGTFVGAVTPEQYDAARHLPESDSARQRLVAELIRVHFQSYESTGTWLDMSSGLQVMTEHAKGLGYEGIVLFLDELVLWLAGHLRDTTFLQSETSKIAKLVETGTGLLAVPVISFVARQRDLKDFVGGGSVGAEQVAIGDSFQWWEDRFDKITLAAADLPQIVHKRLLQPTSEEGRAALHAALAKVRANRGAYAHLLTDEANSSAVDFELVYPFSPALVDAMIGLSTVMQRERTALKIMSQLLSDGRDELTVGDVIGAGDLVDAAVLDGTNPQSAAMKQQFDAARAFYTNKMRPYLLDHHSLTEAQAKQESRHSAFRREDRLAKTLLIAALVPEARSLRNLTASKLAALNFGSVRSMLATGEAATVAALARGWAAEFSEVTVGPQTKDPVISLQLSGVDFDALLVSVQNEDTDASRVRLLCTMLAGEIGAVRAEGQMGRDHVLHHVWRGQRREVDVFFGNIRDEVSLPRESILAADGLWRLIVDVPFDPERVGPAEDVLRISTLRQEEPPSETIAWIPQFFTHARMEEVGKLVSLEHLLRPQWFDQYATELPSGERELARRQLTNRRDALREQIRAALRQAYGIDKATEENVADASPAHHVFHTLAKGFTPNKPSAATFRETAARVLGDALTAAHPDHPEVADGHEEVRRADLQAVLELAREAMLTGGRIEAIDRQRATKVRRVVAGYGVGILNETTYVLAPVHFRWNDTFTKVSRTGTVTVGKLRHELAGLGMTQEAQDLLVLAWAAMTDRQLLRGGTVLSPLPDVGHLAPDVTLVEPVLPSQEDWTAALTAAKALFGIGANEHHLSSAAVQRVGHAVRERARQLEAGTSALVHALDAHRDVLTLDEASPRLRTARTAHELTTALTDARDDADAVDVLAVLDLPDEVGALARSIDSARKVATDLENTNWDLIGQLPDLEDDRAVTAVAQLRGVAANEQLHADIKAALDATTREATAVLVSRKRVSAGRASSATTANVVRQQDEQRRAQQEAREARRALAQERRRAEEERRQAVEARAELKRLREAAAERDRREKEAREQAGQEHQVVLADVRAIEQLGRDLADAIRSPLDGKKLTVTWRWR